MDYGSGVRYRLLKPLVYLLVAAQLLLAVPVGASVATPCDEMEMAGTNDSDPCPCCPDGADSMKDCLASCTLAAIAAPATQVLARASAPSLRVESEPSAPLVSLSDPPLKPPPIR